MAKGGKATGSEHPPIAQQEKVSAVTKHKKGPEREWKDLFIKKNKNKKKPRGKKKKKGQKRRRQNETK